MERPGVNQRRAGAVFQELIVSPINAQHVHRVYASFAAITFPIPSAGVSRSKVLCYLPAAEPGLHDGLLFARHSLTTQGRFDVKYIRLTTSGR